MSICPWCKGRMPVAVDVCPLCGKRAADHPSISSSGYANFSSFDDFDEAAPTVEAGSSATADSLPLAPGAGADAFSDDPLPPSGLFEVDAPTRPLGAPAAPVAIPAGNPPVRSGAASTRPAAAALSVDPYEIAVLADYGPVPDQIYMTPAYAWRVFTRKRELRRRHASAVQAVAEAERTRDDRLAALAERARPLVEKSPDFATMLQPLTDAERMAQDRSDALEQRSAQFGQQTSDVDQRIAEVQTKLQAAQTVVDAARRQLAAREDVLKRSLALQKRVEIELRNTQEMARAAAGLNAKTAPPEYAQRLIDLQRELDDKKRECQAPQAAVDQALSEVKEAERALSTLDRMARTYRAERAKLEQAFTREASLRSQGVQRAVTERRTALIAIGARLVEAQEGLIDPADLQAWRDAQSAVGTRIVDAEKLLRATNSADQAAVKKGFLLIGIGAAAILAILVALVLVFGSSQPV